MGRLKSNEIARFMPKPEGPRTGRDHPERCGVCSMTTNQRAHYPGAVQGGCPMHLPEQNCPFFDHHRPAA